jgi:hypothetical protein
VSPSILRIFEAGLLGSTRHRIELLYLSFTLAFVGLCLGARLWLPARLPKHR